MVCPGDGFLGNPLKDFDDGSVCGAHHDRSAFGNQARGTQRRQVVTNQLAQSFLATGPRLIASYRDLSHGNTFLTHSLSALHGW
jgi:hypothetical protein